SRVRDRRGHDRGVTTAGHYPRMFSTIWRSVGSNGLITRSMTMPSVIVVQQITCGPSWYVAASAGSSGSASMLTVHTCSALLASLAAARAITLYRLIDERLELSPWRMSS